MTVAIARKSNCRPTKAEQWQVVNMAQSSNGLGRSPFKWDDEGSNPFWVTMSPWRNFGRLATLRVLCSKERAGSSPVGDTALFI